MLYLISFLETSGLLSVLLISRLCMPYSEPSLNGRIRTNASAQVFLSHAALFPDQEKELTGLLVLLPLLLLLWFQLQLLSFQSCVSNRPIVLSRDVTMRTPDPVFD